MAEVKKGQLYLVGDAPNARGRLSIERFDPEETPITIGGDRIEAQIRRMGGDKTIIGATDEIAVVVVVDKEPLPARADLTDFQAINQVVKTGPVHVTLAADGTPAPLGLTMALRTEKNDTWYVDQAKKLFGEANIEAHVTRAFTTALEALGSVLANYVAGLALAGVKTVLEGAYKALFGEDVLLALTAQLRHEAGAPTRRRLLFANLSIDEDINVGERWTAADWEVEPLTGALFRRSPQATKGWEHAPEAYALVDLAAV